MSESINELLEMSRMSQIESSGSGSETLYICAEGPPGLAKTKKIEQYAKSINYQYEAVIMSRMPSVDLGGIYVPDTEKGELTHLITHRFLGEDIPEEFDGRLILFDEIGTCSEDQQAALQSMIQDRTLEGHAIPGNVMFAFATNRAEDNCGAGELIQSFSDRLIRVPAEPSKDEWLPWAMQNGVDSAIIGFIAWKGIEGLYQFDPNSNELGQPNYRSWTKVSKAMEYRPSRPALGLVLNGLVGQSTALEFLGFLDLKDSLSTVEEILVDPSGVPIEIGNISALWAMISNIGAYVGKLKADGHMLTKETSDAIIKFLRRMDEPMAYFGFHLIDSASEDFCSSTDEYSKFKVDYKHMHLGGASR